MIDEKKKAKKEKPKPGKSNDDTKFANEVIFIIINNFARMHLHIINNGT